MLDDLAAGYERWLGVIQDGIAAMRTRGDLTREADPRHLAVALLAAHQGGTMLTFATASADPFRVVVNAAVDYVGTFRPVPRKRTRRVPHRGPRQQFLKAPFTIACGRGESPMNLGGSATGHNGWYPP